ncbi:hypothetical protein [Flavobacterium sp.]|uniref:hypothetical protein n=1 Tax=Flavobacterium sp. TaxID=239 RepID=UPI003753D824
MKKVKLLIVTILFLTIANIQAQVSVNVNFGTPPVWAPADRVETQYYYLPDVDAYYDVPAQRFIYINNGVWIRSASLPARYSNYNLRGGRVVYLTDYRGNSPYVYHKNHKVKYKKVYVQPRKTVYIDNDDHGGHKEKNHGKGKKHKD